jgi:VanZ family protein
MGIIFWISTIPNEQLERSLVGIKIPDSIEHVGEYTILGILMGLVITQISNKTFPIVFYSSIFSACYGILDEIHQSFVPTRCFTLFDIYCNITGSIIGVLLYVSVIKTKSYVQDQAVTETEKMNSTRCVIAQELSLEDEIIIKNTRGFMI